MTSKDSETDKTYLKEQIKGDLLEKFKQIKKFYGVHNDSELARILIANEYRRLYEDQ